MNIEDQDETETKEWEEALSLVESIFKDFRENSSDSDDPKNDLLEVARWKVVWGKKPAQYRLKPFLMWSVDEMPSIPEEGESISEDTQHKALEVNEILKIKKDKQMRFLKRKLFKMKRRVDEINVVLAKTLSDETVASSREEDPSKAPTILQLGAQNVELLNERSIIREKMRKLNKRLNLFKGPWIETSQLIAQRQDIGDAPLESSDVKGTDTDEQTPKHQAGEPWSFKNGRRSAIKKEVKGPWNKPGSAQAQDTPRSSCDLGGERKTKKKRCCKGHHKKHEHKFGTLGEPDELGRQALSDGDLRIGTSTKDQGETGQQKRLEALTAGAEVFRKYGLRVSGSTEIHKELTTESVAGTITKDRPHPARPSQEVSSTSRGSRPRRNSVTEGTALKYERESVSGHAGSQIKLGLKKDITRATRSATDLATEDMKRLPETTKHWKTKRSSSNKAMRAARTSHSHVQTVENEELVAKNRPWKSAANTNKAEQPDLPKRITISSVPS